MKKYLFPTIAIVGTIFIIGCQVQKADQQEESAETTNLTEIAEIDNLDYQLVTDEGFTPSYLDLNEDSTFTLDFNLCESMAQGAGKYTVDKDTYFLDVESCKTCEESNDLGLPTVNLELKKISKNELKIQNEVFRIQNGQKLAFCAPNNDPENKYDGVDYNLFVENSSAPTFKTIEEYLTFVVESYQAERFKIGENSVDGIKDSMARIKAGAEDLSIAPKGIDFFEAYVWAAKDWDSQGPGSNVAQTFFIETVKWNMETETEYSTWYGPFEDNLQLLVQ